MKSKEQIIREKTLTYGHEVTPGRKAFVRNANIEIAKLQQKFGMEELEITTDQLHWHKEDQSFSQEASTLNIGPGNLYRTIKVTNSNTGKTEIFNLVKTIMQDEEDIGGWKYESSNLSLGLTLTIWND